MASSQLLIHPTLPERNVKGGLNWGALIFGTIWAYSEGMIARGGRMAAIDAAAGLLCAVGGPLGHPGFAIAALILFAAKNVYCALRGSDWMYRHLLGRGYRLAHREVSGTDVWDYSIKG